MVKSRSSKSIKNILFASGGYFANLLLQLINRFVFVRYLSTEYLGINGLFSNILSMLALSELGVGAAIIFALYEPVANDDKEKIKSLMHLYKKLYTIIGFFVLVVGTIITPFINFFIKEVPDIPRLKFYFLLYVINSGVSYFYTYKRSLIICNQEEYISTITTTASSFLTRLIQIMVLVLTHNYTIFLVVQIVFTRLENVLISKIADKKYPYLKDKDIVPLTDEEKGSIKKNVFAMMIHKIGDIIVNATDSMIVSKILGLAAVGYLSNYTMITDVISSFSNKIFSSLTASIGNLAVKETKEKTETIFYNVLFGNFWFISFCTICLFSLIEPFVTIWLGDKYILGSAVTGALCGCFYLSGMRRTALQFRNATGLFWNDRYKAILESILNLAVSIPLTIHFGIAGVKIGTIISTLLTSFWIEGFILFRYYFKKSSLKYLMKQFFYLTVTVLMCGLIKFIFSFISGWGMLSFVLKCLICVILPNLFYLSFFARTEEFQYFFSLVKRKIKH